MIALFCCTVGIELNVMGVFTFVFGYAPNGLRIAPSFLISHP